MGLTKNTRVIFGLLLFPCLYLCLLRAQLITFIRACAHKPAEEETRFFRTVPGTYVRNQTHLPSSTNQRSRITNVLKMHEIAHLSRLYPASHPQVTWDWLQLPCGPDVANFCNKICHYIYVHIAVRHLRCFCSL